MPATLEIDAPVGPQPFIAYLTAILEAYEVGPVSAPFPTYDGPADRRTDEILRMVEAIGRRMFTAEAQLEAIRAADTAGPESKKRRSSGEMLPPSSSSQGTSAAGEVATPVAERMNFGNFSESADEDGTDTYSIAAATLAEEDEIDMMCPRCRQAQIENAEQQGEARYTSPAPAFENGASLMDELTLLKAGVQDVSRVCAAVARGDLTKKISMPVQGDAMIHMKETVNDMVDKLAFVAREIEDVSLAVSEEGRLDQQALTDTLSGTWLDLADSTNALAATLTHHVRASSDAWRSLYHGSFERSDEGDGRGDLLQYHNVVEGVMMQMRIIAAETTRVTLELSMGKLGQTVHIPDTDGMWMMLGRTINNMSQTFTDTVRQVRSVAAAVAKGDYTQKMDVVHAEGEIGRLVNTVNRMVDELSNARARL